MAAWNRSQVAWLLLLTVSVSLSACGEPDSPSSPSRSATTSQPTTAPPPGITIDLPYQAGSVGVGGGWIWVIPHLDPVVLRVDPATNRVVQEIALPGVVGAEIDANDESVWISVSTAGSFAPAGAVRIDPATGALSGPFVDAVSGGFPSIGRDGVWLGDPSGYARLHQRTGDVLDVVRTTGGGGHLSTTRGLWVAHSEGVWEVAASTGVADEIGKAVARLEPGPFGVPYEPVAEHAGRVWGVGAVEVIALDVKSHEVARTVDLPEGLSPCPDGAISDSVFWLIAANGGSCWVAPSVLVGIDTATGDVIAEQPLEFSNEFGMDVLAGDVWIPVIRQPAIIRIPLRSEQ